MISQITNRDHASSHELLVLVGPNARGVNKLLSTNIILLGSVGVRGRYG